MPEITRVHAVAYSAEQMFDLVADVEQYPQFLPLCESLTIRSRQQRGEAELLVASMAVGYKAIRETFTTRVLLKRAELVIDVTYVDGPFKRLFNRWRFEPVAGPAGETGCKVHFHIDYEFSSRILGALMGSMFDAAFRRFTSAFEERARVVYGPPANAHV